jgi:hypothetical protein
MKHEIPCRNRLIILGPARTIARLTNNDRWLTSLEARYIEWMEFSPRRHVLDFSTPTLAAENLKNLSRRWRTLVFLLVYEHKRRIGLIKITHGKIEGCRLRY